MFVSLALLLLVAHFIAPLCCRVEEMLFHRPELAKSTALAPRSNQTIDWRLIAERFTAMPRTLARAQRGPNPAFCCTDRGSSCVFTSQEHNFEEKKSQIQNFISPRKERRPLFRFLSISLHTCLAAQMLPPNEPAWMCFCLYFSFVSLC